jgi:hypothetical protein
MRALFNRIEGYYKLIEQREQGEWERVRWQSTLILQMFAKKGRKVKPKDLIVFPWEEEKALPKPPARKLSPEEIRQKFAEADRKMREAWQRSN